MRDPIRRGRLAIHDMPRAVWNVIETDLPPLEAALRRMQSAIGEG